MSKSTILKVEHVVNNPNLKKIGEFRISTKEGNTYNHHQFSISAGTDAVSLEIVGDAYFSNDSFAENSGKTVAIPKVSRKTMYIVGTTFYIRVYNKYAITRAELNVTNNLSEWLEVDVESFAYSTELAFIGGIRNIRGDISAFSGLENITQIIFTASVADSYLRGNIGSVLSNTKLNTLQIYNCFDVEGDISALSSLTSLNTVTIYGCKKLFGNLEEFAQNQWRNGKRSNTVVQAVNSGVKWKGENITTTRLTISFTDSGYTIA